MNTSVLYYKKRFCYEPKYVRKEALSTERTRITMGLVLEWNSWALSILKLVRSEVLMVAGVILLPLFLWFEINGCHCYRHCYQWTIPHHHPICTMPQAALRNIITAHYIPSHCISRRHVNPDNLIDTKLLDKAAFLFHYCNDSAFMNTNNTKHHFTLCQLQFNCKCFHFLCKETFLTKH